jgi:drug/metabolite transporter (DMT)-like permease
VTGSLGYGLSTAVVSAALYGIAPLAQAKAARRETAGAGLGLGLLARLVLRPLWLVGLVVETGAFLLEVYALSVAPVALVAPVMALDMIVFTLLAQRVLAERVSRRGWWAIGAMIMAVGMLAYAFADHVGIGSPADTKELLSFLVLGMVFVLVMALLADRAAAASRVAAAALGFGLAAGVAYAIATLATRQIGLAFDARRSGRPYLVELMTTPTPYLLLVFSVLAIGLEQRALQGRAAVISFPVTSGVTAFLPVVLGLTLFDEPAPRGPHLVAFVAALALIATGIVGLGQDRTAALRSGADDAAVLPAAASSSSSRSAPSSASSSSSSSASPAPSPPPPAPRRPPPSSPT